MQEYNFLVKFIEPASLYPKPAPSKKERTRTGTGTITTNSEKQAIKEIIEGYKNLGMKVLEVAKI
jgi:hypothetical protein